MPPSESNARGPHAHNAGRPSDGRDSTRRRQGGTRGSEKRASDERARGSRQTDRGLGRTTGKNRADREGQGQERRGNSRETRSRESRRALG